MLYPTLSDRRIKVKDRFHRTVVNIQSIEVNTIHVVLPSIDKNHAITLNRDVIPIMFYGVLIQQDDPYLLATANTEIDVKDIHKLIIKDWELPNISMFDFGFIDSSKLNQTEKILIHSVLNSDLYTNSTI